MTDVREIIATAIANARGMRRGAPGITNMLEFLELNGHQKLADEVRDDADNILTELKNAGLEIKALPKTQDKGEAQDSAKRQDIPSGKDSAKR